MSNCCHLTRHLSVTVQTVNIYGDRTGDSAKPTSVDGDLSSREPTTAAVVWNPENSATVGDALNTPDISSIVREIVGLPGLCLGYHMYVCTAVANSCVTPQTGASATP